MSDVDALMKRCQVGVGGRRALDDAHDIMAECYGTLGRMRLEIERLRGEADVMRGWIKDALVPLEYVQVAEGDEDGGAAMTALVEAGRALVWPLRMAQAAAKPSPHAFDAEDPRCADGDPACGDCLQRGACLNAPLTIGMLEAEIDRLRGQVVAIGGVAINSVHRDSFCMPTTHGVIRCADHRNALTVVFKRHPTDDEMRGLHELIKAHAA